MEDCVGHRTRSAIRHNRTTSEEHQEGDQSTVDTLGRRGVSEDLRELGGKLLEAAKRAAEGGMYQQMRDPQRRLSMMSADNVHDAEMEEAKKTSEPFTSRFCPDDEPPTLSRQDESMSDSETGAENEENDGTQCTKIEQPPQNKQGRVKQRYMIDDRGWWVVFDVAKDHYLHGCYSAY